MQPLPRESSQMRAFIKGLPSLSTATVPDHCVVQQTATISSTDTSPLASNLRDDLMMAPHHSSGLCSAPPPGRRISGVSSHSQSTTSPQVETSADLGPQVPRSIAKMYFAPHSTSLSIKLQIRNRGIPPSSFAKLRTDSNLSLQGRGILCVILPLFSGASWHTSPLLSTRSRAANL
ncbi:MAG: hypothetical protein DDT27_01602 [Dehalococcoidia bacterium]|nr:hypothetical protein [Chloroflexota bacterium]MBT9163034.1 hypothetical protein [Chloroflexota bacterium]